MFSLRWLESILTTLESSVFSGFSEHTVWCILIPRVSIALWQNWHGLVTFVLGKVGSPLKRKLGS
jgi:hypothetical protein